MAFAMARLDTVARAATTAAHGGTVRSWPASRSAWPSTAPTTPRRWATELQLAVEQEPWPGGVDVRVQRGPAHR